MVYCGKPSKGCSNCRERKIRCDQKEPGCGQCEKRQQACPGYRNLVDLMFRDESSHVISKAAKTRSRASSSESRVRSRSRRKRAVASSSASVSASERPTPSPTPPNRPAPASVASSGFALLKPPALAGLTPRSGTTSSSSPSDRSLESLDEAEGETDAESVKTKVEPGSAPKDDVAKDVAEGVTQDGSPYDLSPSLLERGIAFFFSRYVTVDNSCHQNYSFIYDIWKPPDPAAEYVVDGVTASMTAVGLAGLAQLTNDRETMHQARQSYGIALNLTNAALADRAEAVKDTTMLAVLILGAYEFLAGHSPQTMRAWQDHVNGAAALASLRGTAQFQSKAGVRMFLMLSHSILISCIQSGLPMPQVIVNLRRQLQGLYQDDNPAWGVSDPIYRALQVRHDIKIGKLSNVDEIIQSLSKVDDELALILSRFPPSWHYRQVQLAKSDPRVLGRCCHVYPGLLQVTTWNGVRAVRMLVLETILEQLSSRPRAIDHNSLPHHHQEHLSRAVRLLQRLGEAIVASVPQHFGVVSFRDGSSPTTEGATVSLSAQHPAYRARSPGTAKASPREEKASQSSRLRTPTLLDPTRSEGEGDDAECFMTLASASHTIIWPLYILGLSSTCSGDVQDYAIDRLHAIHKETGLEQARVVAGMLEARKALGPHASIPLDELPQPAASLFSVTV